MCFWWKAAVRLRLRRSLLEMDLTEAGGAGQVFWECLWLSGVWPARRLTISLYVSTVLACSDFDC
jgi:hypothetical protein